MKKLKSIIITLIVISILTPTSLVYAEASAPSENFEPVPSAQEIFQDMFPTQDYFATINVLAKTLHGEAKGVKDDDNRESVIWCILNRVQAIGLDKTTPILVAKAPHQFAYSKRTKYRPDEWTITQYVLDQWLYEQIGIPAFDRPLPDNFRYFGGNGKYNKFRLNYKLKSRGQKYLTPKDKKP